MLHNLILKPEDRVNVVYLTLLETQLPGPGVLYYMAMRFELGDVFGAQICHNYYTSKMHQFRFKIKYLKKYISYHKKSIHFLEVNFTGIKNYVV